MLKTFLQPSNNKKKPKKVKSAFLYFLHQKRFSSKNKELATLMKKED